MYRTLLDECLQRAGTTWYTSVDELKRDIDSALLQRRVQPQRYRLNGRTLLREAVGIEDVPLIVPSHKAKHALQTIA